MVDTGTQSIIEGTQSTIEGVATEINQSTEWKNWMAIPILGGLAAAVLALIAVLVLIAIFVHRNHKKK